MKKFLNLDDYSFNYLKKLNQHILNLDLNKIEKLAKLFLYIKKKKKKIILVGNGGSAAMASHVSVDLTKVVGIRAINFNEADLITCFVNDYGQDNWIKEAISKYYDFGDLVILISSSGNSRNQVVAANFCRKKKIKLVTFTGFSGLNRLAKLGNLNVFVESQNYNQIEMTHHVWLLLVCDYILRINF
jgi:D-sedoheptulose 7-phosphate isomerase